MTDAHAVPQLAAQHHPLHGRVERHVLRGHSVGGREVQPVERGRQRGLHTPQVLVHRLGEEGREGRHHAAHGQQHIVQHRQCHCGVIHAAGALEAFAVEADVDVGEILDKVDQKGRHVVKPIRLHLLLDVSDEGMAGGVEPTVQHVGGLGCVHLAGVELGAVLHLKTTHVLDEEAVGVVPGQEEALDVIKHPLLAKLQRLRAHNRRIDEVQPQRVRAVLVHYLFGVGVVLQPLAHLLPVRREHEAVANQVLKGGLVEQRGGQDHQGVEPAARLVQPLRDKVGGEVGLEELLVLKRVVQLTVRHAARLEPTVKHFIYAPEVTLALLGRDDDVIDEMAM
mmetsp:Transcript_16342/g.29130  ORF Transcript_16342/g.29130 Transcript_16342/m.29130 type:complete len:337 (-) Transcript_16342:1806-2816(-)